MDTTTAQSIKLTIMSATGLSKDALHIYVGMTVYLTLIAITRRYRPYVGCLVVFILACAGEWVDRRGCKIRHWAPDLRTRLLMSREFYVPSPFGTRALARVKHT